eukprot:2252068-Rhodomonas_salina.2
MLTTPRSLLGREGRVQLCPVNTLPSPPPPNRLCTRSTAGRYRSRSAVATPASGSFSQPKRGLPASHRTRHRPRALAMSRPPAGQSDWLHLTTREQDEDPQWGWSCSEQ